MVHPGPKRVLTLINCLMKPCLMGSIRNLSTSHIHSFELLVGRNRDRILRPCDSGTHITFYRSRSSSPDCNSFFYLYIPRGLVGLTSFHKEGRLLFVFHKSASTLTPNCFISPTIISTWGTNVNSSLFCVITLLLSNVARDAAMRSVNRYWISCH